MKKKLLKLRTVFARNEIDQKSKLLRAVNSVAEMLLTADEGGFEDSLREAMALVARCLHIDRIYIWRNQMMDGHLAYVQRFEWLGDFKAKGKTVRSDTGFTYAESIPEWEERFLKDECVNGPLSTLSNTERDRLGPYDIKSILVIPVHLRDCFWGFVSFDDCHKERTFTDDEISILRSANLMMASAMYRYETAAKMREADERVKLMLDATPLSCSLWDRDFNMIDCNEEAVKLFGLKNKQEYIERYFELSPERQPNGRHSKEKLFEYIDKAFEEGRIVFEWIRQKPDGTLIPAEMTFVRVKHGDEYIVAGYVRDLREHKKMMESIEYKDTLLHTVTEVATMLLQSEMNDFEGVLRQCMSKIADSVRIDRMYIWKNHIEDGVLCGTQLYEWSGGAEPQQGSKYTTDIPYCKAPNWEQTLSSGQCINGLVRSMTAAEQAYLSPQGILSLLVVPVFLRDQFWGFVGFDDCHRERVFSETEESILRSGSLLIANALLRNEMTNEIHAAVEKAQAASNAKSAFLAHMSHEIRTPMNVIAGMTELVLREAIPEAITEHVLNIKYASANMLSLIKDILDFSKIEAGDLDIASAEYSLTSLINNVLIVIRMKVSEKPILFTANIDCNIPSRLIGDETRIRQILLNVLDNAVKYTAEGYISLTVSGEIIEDTIVLKADISDSGIGIKKENMDRLFDDFMRFDSERNRCIQGTGLGLAITKSLCQAMGGSISVHSEYCQGSTFSITIPQKIKSRDEKFASVIAPDTKRVLLYETYPVYADSIVRSLDNLGVSYTLVKEAQELFEELKSRSYQYVFVPSLLAGNAGRMIQELKLDTTLVLLTEFGEVPAMRGVRTIATPAHAASIASILNDIEENIFYNEGERETILFIAPSSEILVVDDLNANLKVIQGLMLPYQMKVDVCESGEAALECVQRKRYDIIFMDHMMLGIDGLEATGRIRSMEDGSGYYESVPIIALTANAISGAKETFLQNGMSDFLAKPIDVNKLHGLLEKWIPKDKKEKFRKIPAKPSADINPVQIQIEGVDVQAGIAMTGGAVSGYVKMLNIFCVDGTDKINKIRDCMEKKDNRLYTTYVHAMKSAAASIGAWEISENFKALEMAGARGDVSFVCENTERFLDELETLLNRIGAVVSMNQDGPTKENDPEFLREELWKLREAIESRDAGEIDDIMLILETARWNQKADDIFKEVSRSILMINYTDAAIWVDRLLSVFN